MTTSFHIKKVDPFLIKKWNYAFTVFFDINKTNFLEWQDFAALIELIRRARGDDSVDYKNAQDTMREIWQKMLQVSDLNEDGKVSVEEWHHMWYEYTQKKMSYEWETDYLEYMFQLLDVSGDRLIDLSEYIEVMEVYGTDRQEAIESFDKFARNKDGQNLYAIDYDTYCRLWREFFESTDPDAPGNFLFGDFERQH